MKAVTHALIICPTALNVGNVNTLEVEWNLDDRKVRDLSFRLDYSDFIQKSRSIACKQRAMLAHAGCTARRLLILPPAGNRLADKPTID